MAERAGEHDPRGHRRDVEADAPDGPARRRASPPAERHAEPHPHDEPDEPALGDLVPSAQLETVPAAELIGVCEHLLLFCELHHTRIRLAAARAACQKRPSAKRSVACRTDR